MTVSSPSQPETPVADAMETLRDAAVEWKVSEAMEAHDQVIVSFRLPLSAIERDVKS